MRRDWHPEDIKAALGKRGIALADLARTARNISRQSIAAALVMPHERAEKIIAAALDTKPATIWPSRFHPNGIRKSPQPRGSYCVAARFRRKAA